ncbi:hypothetical protein lbkm_1556 [Lachnospiraceae bacterium KM106-2]|nr:hypothetical protein lbkm_1556 [Lachnospiraceae bacterium KM106-2]
MEWFKKHWIMYTLVITIPSIWFTVIIGQFGVKLKLKSPSGDLTKVGIILTFIVVIAIFLVNGYRNWISYSKEYDQLLKLNNEVTFYHYLEESEIALNNYELATLRSKIAQVYNHQIEAPKVASDPNQQLTRILEKINATMCVFLSKPGYKFSESDFFITLAYTFPCHETEWMWLEGTQEGEISIQELTSEEKRTTFTYLLHSNKTYYFNNSKVDAMQKGQYLFNEQEQTSFDDGEEIGSVFCRRYDISNHGKTYIRAILSISTNGKKFVDTMELDKNKKAGSEGIFKANMLNITKERFGIRICKELCLLYLKFLAEIEDEK